MGHRSSKLRVAAAPHVPGTEYKPDKLAQFSDIFSAEVPQQRRPHNFLPKRGDFLPEDVPQVLGEEPEEDDNEGKSPDLNISDISERTLKKTASSNEIDLDGYCSFSEDSDIDDEFTEEEQTDEEPDIIFAQQQRKGPKKTWSLTEGMKTVDPDDEGPPDEFSDDLDINDRHVRRTIQTLQDLRQQPRRDPRRNQSVPDGVPTTNPWDAGNYEPGWGGAGADVYFPSPKGPAHTAVEAQEFQPSSEPSEEPSSGRRGRRSSMTEHDDSAYSTLGGDIYDGPTIGGDMYVCPSSPHQSMQILPPTPQVYKAETDKPAEDPAYTNGYHDEVPYPFVAAPASALAPSPFRAPAPAPPTAEETMGMKSNSTSSIYTTTTISDPNASKIIMSASIVIHHKLSKLMTTDNGSGPAENTEQGQLLKETLLDFDERTYSARDLDMNTNHVPSFNEILEFYTHIYEIAQFSAQCNVIFLIYIHRLINKTGMSLHGNNWRFISLVALLVAQKMWDDRSLGNTDFPILWMHAVPSAERGLLTLRTVNRQERSFLELIQYDVKVSTSLYASLYFELQEIVGKACGVDRSPFKVLNVEEAEMLRLFDPLESTISKEMPTVPKRSSLFRVNSDTTLSVACTNRSRARAVLS